MRVVEGFFSDVLAHTTDFVLNRLLPWAWDNKLWIASLIPIFVVIAIIKWIRD